MTPILPLALTGVGLVAGAKFLNKRSQSMIPYKPLVRQLALSNGRRAKPPVGLAAFRQTFQEVAAQLNAGVTTLVDQTQGGREGLALVKVIGAQLTLLDDHYQQWVHEQIDPLFGQQRQAQQRELAAGRRLALTPEQKQANYSLLLGVAGLGLAGVAHLLALPITFFSVLIGLYIMTPLIKLGYRLAVHDRKFSTAHLMLLYFAGMWLGGYLVIGAAGLILMAFARKVQILSEASTRDELVSIFGQQPRTAWLLVNGVETEVPMAQVLVGDILVIDVGQMIPVDGVIVDGVASIDQHMLTGEAQPAEKSVGDAVLAATIVLSGRIFVQVEKAGAETTANQIGEILNRTARYRLSIQEKSTQIADRSLIPMLIGCGLGYLLAGPLGATAILGCNFTLSMMGLTPLTMLNFLNQSSRAGILVKEGNALEKLHTVDTMLFDKTGTLTVEQPHMVQIHTCATLAAEAVLRLAAAAEHRQTHPVAQAILAAAAAQQLIIPKVEDAHYEVGYGIKVRVASSEWQVAGLPPTTSSVAEASPATHHSSPVCVGSWRFMEMEGIAIPAPMQSLLTTCQTEGHSLVFVALDGQLVGALELKATVRAEARQVVDELRRRGMQLYIISGDQEAPTRTLAHELGMDGYFANTLPEHKADLVEQLKAQGRKVCFIGDGINDAIALKKADVSVSLRGATTAATDTAQVVLMDADLSQLITLIRLVDELHKNLNLNFNVAMTMSLLGAGGVLFFNAGFAIVEALFAAQLVTGVGIASMPLFKQPGGQPI